MSLQLLRNFDQESLFKFAVELKNSGKYPQLKDWDIENPNDVLRFVLDAQLKAIELLAELANFFVQNTNIYTARTRQAVINNARKYNYIPYTRLRSIIKCLVNILSGSSEVIPANSIEIFGFNPEGSKILFTNLESIDLSFTGSKVIEVEFIEGTPVENIYQSNGEPNQVFIINGNLVPNTLKIRTIYQQVVTHWNLVDSFYPVGQENVYTLTELNSETYQILFGNGSKGNIPPKFSQIVLNYFISSGSKGNGVTTISGININPSVRIASITAISISSGGEDGETTEHIRYFAPRVSRTNDRLVNKIDVDSFVNAYPGIAKAKTFNLGTTLILCYVVPSSYPVPLSNHVKNQLLNEANSKLVFNFKLLVQEPTLYINPSFSLIVIAKEGVDLNVLRSELNNSLLNLLNPLNENYSNHFVPDFGRSLKVADILYEVRRNEKVLNVLIPKGQVTYIKVLSGGSGFTYPPIVEIALPESFDGVRAQAEAVLDGDKIASIRITNPGSGYMKPPSITLIGDGRNAIFELLISNDEIITSVSATEILTNLGATLDIRVTSVNNLSNEEYANYRTILSILPQ